LLSDLLFCNWFPLHEFLKFQNIIVTIISNTVPFAAVTSCPSCLLIIPFKTFRYIIMNYEPYIRLINPHSKGNCGHNNISLFHKKLILVYCVGSLIHAGVIWKSFNSIYLKNFCHFLDFLTAETINNSRLPGIVFNIFNDLLCYILFGLYLVIKVRTVKGRFKYVCIQNTQVFLNIVLNFWSGCCCKGNNGRSPYHVNYRSDPSVFRPEIVTPLRNTMGLINSIKGYIYIFKELNIFLFCKRFGSNIQKFCLSRQYIFFDSRYLGLCKR